ncbi:hypothetical protein SLEP1_g25843 [Rubroshorea leprosula]|uniref:Uncharacterized protein n=1 Tax=Rubroshorea leprosula TaxID=152421 RepID=A0AAV5JVY5_9ROSI|nr:hypothetical protein SLEP1_g25843 [Rubroshorea leprosula]
MLLSLISGHLLPSIVHWMVEISKILARGFVLELPTFIPNFCSYDGGTPVNITAAQPKAIGISGPSKNNYAQGNVVSPLNKIELAKSSSKPSSIQGWHTAMEDAVSVTNGEEEDASLVESSPPSPYKACYWMQIQSAGTEEGDTDDDANVDFKIASNGERQQEKERGREGTNIYDLPPVELRSLTAPTNLGSKARNKTSRGKCPQRRYRRIFIWVASTLQVAEPGNPFMEQHQTHSTFEH